MARPTVLLVVAFVLVVAEPGIASKPEPISTLRRVPPLLDCGPAPVALAAESDGFRANVLALLRVIPSAAAATPAPAGFVTARSGRTGRDRAFARALCFGAASNLSSSATAAACRACLSAAARDATGGCGGSRRSGVWRGGCFLGYADTDALSAREDAFHGWFYVGPSTTAATLDDRVCAGDRKGPDCARCFEDAARAAAALPWLVRMRGEVIVVGYSCCLRVQSYVLPIRSELSYTISSSILANPCIASYTVTGSTGYSKLSPFFNDRRSNGPRDMVALRDPTRYLTAHTMNGAILLSKKMNGAIWRISGRCSSSIDALCRRFRAGSITSSSCCYSAIYLLLGLSMLSLVIFCYY